MKFGEKFQLESEMFDCISEIHVSFANKNKNDYNAFLDILEELNLEYELKYGKPHISEEKLLNLHSKKWEFYG